MKFKGTKVFPKYEGGDNYSIDLIFGNGATISIDRSCRYSGVIVCDRQEMEANALLISKSREMLEMLNYIMYKTNFKNHFPTTAISVENLIKQATEL